MISFAFIYALVIALTTASSQYGRKHRLQVDITKNDLNDIWCRHSIFCSNRNHDSWCPFFVWQKVGGVMKMLAAQGGIRDTMYINFNQEANLDAPLFFTTMCGDGLWVDAFNWQTLSTVRATGQLLRITGERKYGEQNTYGWCVSADRGDWRHFSGNVPQRTCYNTVELEAFNSIPSSRKGRVWGFGTPFPSHGRRVLESESQVDPFAAALNLYLQCAQTLGDGDVCKRLSGFAAELFDQDKFVLLSEDVDEDDQSNDALTNDESEDTMDSNDRRKLLAGSIYPL